MKEPVVYLAPFEGYAGWIYRTVFCRRFGRVDKVFAPFITTKQMKSGRGYKVRDILPENNPVMPPVPQIMSREPGPFLQLAGVMTDLGYTEINWNLGCPYPTAVKKKRGAGLLPYPDEIDALLDTVCPGVQSRLSIKTRLGHHDPEDLKRLAPVLNRYPLSEVIIHPRTAVQMYGGSAHPDRFAEAASLLSAPVVYNGDIRTVEDYRRLSARFPDVSAWMAGRGALGDPFLPGMMKGGPAPGPAERIRVLREFHDDLFTAYRDEMAGPGHLLDRMKGLWQFFGYGLPGRERMVGKMKKTRQPDAYRVLAEEFFAGAVRALL